MMRKSAEELGKEILLNDKTLIELNEEIVSVAGIDYTYNVELCFYDAFWKCYIYSLGKEKGIADFRDGYVEGEYEAADLNYDKIDSYKDLIMNIENEFEIEKMINRIISDKNLEKNNKLNVNGLGWEYKKRANGTFELPDKKFLALHFLFLQNKDFNNIFRNIRNRKNESYARQILKYNEQLEQTKDNVEYGLPYEKLTGLNLAILAANYLHLIRKNMRKGENDFQKKNLKEKFEEIKEKVKKYMEIIIEVPLITRLYLLNVFCFEILWRLCTEYERNTPVSFGWPEKSKYKIETSVVQFAENYISDFQEMQSVKKFNDVINYLHNKIEKKMGCVGDMDLKISYQLLVPIDAKIRYLEWDIYKLSEISSIRKMKLSTSFVSAMAKAREEIFYYDKIFEKVCNVNSLKSNRRNATLSDGFPFTVEGEKGVEKRVSKVIEKISKGKSEDEKRENINIAGVRWVEERESILKSLMAKLTLNYMIPTEIEESILFRKFDKELLIELIAYTMETINKT